MQSDADDSVVLHSSSSAGKLRVTLSGFSRIDLKLRVSVRSLLQCMMGLCQASQLPAFKPHSAHNAALMSCSA